MSIPCPKCGQTVEVPTIRNFASLPQEQSNPKSAAPTKSTRWSLPLGIFAGLCFLVLSVSWGYAALIALERFGYRDILADLDKWTVEQELEYGDTMVAAYTKAELYDVWDEYRTMGLGTKEPPRHFVMKNALDAGKQRMILMLGIGAVALAGIIAATFAGRARATKSA